MKKIHFIVMIMSISGIVFFVIGMCMTMLPELNMFNQGTIIGIVGLLILIATLKLYYKLENKKLFIS